MTSTTASDSPVDPPADSLPLPAPDKVTFEVIDDDDALADACGRWRRLERVALDTEFVRERTFYPALGLVQVAGGDETALVDPLAIEDLEPLRDLLTDSSVTKILHSCSEDLEVFDVHLGVLPDPLFDTQVAAALLGRGYSPGYARLIEDLFGIEVPKGETRSNWLRRPLRPAQLHYAALDVAYLLQAERKLDSELRQLGRRSWFDEEMAGILESARRQVPDEELYLKVGRARHMNRHQLAILRDLHAWRQRQARKRDLPRSFIVKDAALLDLALRPPRSFQQLGERKDLDRRTVDRHGRAMLKVVRQARELPEDQLPERLPAATDLTEHKATVARLRREIKRLAEELGVAPELLASRRTVERLVRRWIDGEDPLMPAALRGWRSEVAGEALRAKLGS